MSIVSESFSTGFGVDGVTIEQTLFKPYDVYSGMDINTASFQNTNQGLEQSNQDGRIELGMFFFDEDNQSSENYSNTLGENFKIIPKINFIPNGSGKYVYSTFKDPNTEEERDFYLPQGGWGYCTYDGIEDRRRNETLYSGSYSGAYIENTNGGQNHIDSFAQSSGTPDDNHGTIGYAGYYPYFFDYRLLLNPEEFTTNLISADELNDDGDEFGERKPWNYFDTSLLSLSLGTAAAFDEVLVNQRNTDDGKITSMKIEKIRDEVTGKEVIFKSTGLTAYGSIYVSTDWDSSDGTDFYDSNFTKLIKGRTYKFTFKNKTNEDEPVVDELRWNALLNISQEIESSGILETRDDSIEGAPLRLQQNLKHAMELSSPQDACTNFYYMNHYDCAVGTHDGDYNYLNSDLTDSSYRSLFTGPITNIVMPRVKRININEEVDFPNFAKWIMSSEAYSYGRCLEFLAMDFQESYTDLNMNGDFSNTTIQQNGFNWSQFTDEWTNAGGAVNNQYRSLNQVVKIYEGGADAEPFLEPYSSVKISFKMKTDSNFINASIGRPRIETAIVDSDGRLYSPLRVEDFIGDINIPYNKKHIYWPNGGEFNSQTYNDNFHSNNTVNRRTSNYGSMGRFQNTENDVWEEFSYTFILGDNFLYNDTKNLRDLFFIVQASDSNFRGRVLLDDFEMKESFEFYPDCDVRKKISTGQYGKADLTKYYDKELQPEEYKDSQGPMEAQFYFYPTYPTDKIFDVKRTPMYNDFKKGLFYIKDVDWGDGSSIEFSEPVQIDEEEALYHTYTEHGIFEVTGLMIRKKIDSEGEELGVVHVKKFRLRININEGVNDDFDFFGNDGFSFIPFRNTLPVIGGISKQSSYYKSIKRQLGFIDDLKTFVKFKNKSDKMKTELALLKMENQSDNDLEVLPNYLVERYTEDIIEINDEDVDETSEYLATLPFPQYREDFDILNSGLNNFGDLFVAGDRWFDFGRKDIGNFLFYLTLGYEEVPQGDENNTPFVYPDYVDLYFYNQNLMYEEGGTGVAIPQAPYENLLNGLEHYYHPDMIEVTTGEKVYNGLSPIREELGKGIGDCDLTNIKYYNEPKSIWELFGFEDGDLEEIGTPDNPRYWKNIIPKGYSIFNRYSITNESNNPIPQNTTTTSDIKLYMFAPDDDGYVPIYYTSNEDLTQIQLEFLPLSSDLWGYSYHNVDAGDNTLDYQNGEFPSMKVLSYYTGDAGVHNTGTRLTAGDYQVSRAHMNPEHNIHSQQHYIYGKSRMQEGVTDVPHVFPRTDLPKLLMKIRFKHQESIQDDGSGNPVNLPEEQYIAYQDRWLPADFISDIPQVGEFYVYNNSTQMATGIEPGPYFPAYLTYDSNGVVIDGGTDMSGLFNDIVIDDFTGQSYTIYFHPNQYSTGIFETEVEEEDGEVEETEEETEETGIYANQDWIDINEELGFGHRYYYPVLPTYEANGKFVDIKFDENNNVVSGYPLHLLDGTLKIPFSPQGSITDESEQNENLLINITTEQIETNVYNDNSGNDNLGFSISDYKPNFNNETLKPLKRKTFSRMKNSKTNGAF